MTNRRRGKILSTKIPIYTLSGGVGRQAPSKRLPSESQDLVNAMVSVERSIEKRPGTDLMPVYDDATSYTGEELGLDFQGSFEFFWHSLSDNARYLIAVDRNASENGDTLYNVFYFNQDSDRFEDHTQADQTGIPAEVRAYLTHGTEPLKLVSRGQNLVFLNPGVTAGYTSIEVELESGDTVNGQSGLSGSYWVKMGLNGVPIGKSANPLFGSNYQKDDIGAEEDYLTAYRVDPAGIAVLWNKYTSYATGTNVLYLAGSSAVPPSTGDVDSILAASTSITAVDDANTNWEVISKVGATNANLYDLDRIPKRVSVQDYEYPDSTSPQLGQSLPVFTDMNIPPLTVDVTNGNNNAETMLETLYGLTGGGVETNSADGRVYYIQTGYQGQPPGYYLASSVDSPSFTKVRTPDPYSVLDANRMPMELEFVGGAPGDQWAWSTIDWAQRTSGDKENNPGPTPFKDGRQSQIKTIAFFRNRLFMSSGDVIFSSRDGDFTDLWIGDPGIIVDTDPIDVAASSNQFTPITSMVPFNEYMFINTNADTQYELMGSENQITPFTAQLQPMTFYSTAPLVDPMTLGNNIFFYDAERLYLYFGRGGTLATAQELSAHCPKYLPTSFGPTAVAAAQDTLMVVDAENTSDVYAYTTRYRGDQVVQNAFYKYEYAGADVQAMHSWDNYVYTVVNRNGSFFIERQLMRYDETNIPRLDRKQRIPLFFNVTLSPVRGGTNAVFDAASSETTIRVPFVIEPADLDEYQVVGTDGTAYTLCGIRDTSTDVWTDICVSGNLSGQAADVYVGRKFTMSIQLSPQFLRDDQNNPQEGILNLASMVTRHFETGNYDVVAQRRGRPVADIQSDYKVRDTSLMDFTTTFSAIRTDTFDDSNLGISNTDYQGELVSKIMGFSDKVDLYILSDYFTPVNITNLEIRGKFKATYSSIT